MTTTMKTRRKIKASELIDKYGISQTGKRFEFEGQTAVVGFRNPEEIILMTPEGRLIAEIEFEEEK